MGTKVGNMIKEARSAAKISQAKLAEAVGISAKDLSKAEAGELELTQAAIKKIAAATGVTQKSLLDAYKAETEKTVTKAASAAKAAVKKTAAAKTTATKKTATKTAAAKTYRMELTAAEKTLVEAYRKANAGDKKDALKVLKDQVEVADAEDGGLLSSVLSGLLSK